MWSRALGVDACRAGWVGVVLHGGGAMVHVAETIAALVADAEAAGHLAVIGIDIPIGLPDTGRGAADVLAYQLMGPSTVVGVHDAGAGGVGSWQPRCRGAGEPGRERVGAGVSAQVYGLRSKILEVDGWVRHARSRVVEVHPEVSLAGLAGGPLPDGKRTWAGARHRRRLLAAAGIDLADDVGHAGRHAAVDDVLDAGAAAWTAARVAAGAARPLPGPPVEYSDGWPAAIWV
jgi:predicted RNase H-like nuclease